MVTGRNGSGKSTLLRVAMGLLPPSRGRITWGGRENAPPLKRAIVFQRPAMLRRSVAANIRFALRAAGVPRAEHARRTGELLELVGLGGLADRAARRLSGGEQQRLALARALARDPAVLFLDEPTASLDPTATKAVEDIIRAVSARNIKVVMATHDLGEARRLAGDIVMLHRGRVVDAGAAASFLDAPQTSEARAFLAGELLI
jgi:tungstate transport system ATP-binding protein